MNPLDALPLAQAALIPYVIANRPDYRPAGLHYTIANALQRVEAGELKRVMFFVPPRHGKSMLTSEHFPAWYLGRHPGDSIVTATYGQELADDFGRKIRNQMLDPLYNAIFPGCTVSPDSASVSRVSTQQHGNYFAVGIGTALTGRGANVLIIDDPHKDRTDADSVIMRKRFKDWYQAVAYTRLTPDGAIVVMQTRWHEDDAAGWLLREHADQGWEVICMPAFPDAPWPERFSHEMLDNIRKVVGPREWSALYMQSPVPGGGGEFKREYIRYYDGSPEVIGAKHNKYILVDPAGEQRPENDFTSIWVIGLGDDNNAYWLDGIRDRLALPDRGREVLRLHRKWRPLEVRYERYGMMGDIQYLRELQQRENYRFDVIEVSGSVKKNDRIRRLLPMFEHCRFYFPHSMNYTDRSGTPRDLVRTFIEEELISFAAGLHDDMLDSLARLMDTEGRVNGELRELTLKYPSEHMKMKPIQYSNAGII